ncbi:hypothetical protein [Pseudoalteromonas piscicida]|uniref:hypothetical protein n=1 Tax=Pseudoalteromonas piscicida TaxID=43662 RepID=UPI001C954926|nr:hypothetical protein [Pseudoalteromonas piscicida]QZO11377.1 hypothetical protein K5642_09450 [Pseudoalteromonas piscicida]
MTDEYEGYDEDEIAAAEEAREIIDEIISRCKEASIEYDNNSDEEEFGVVDVSLTVYLPSGRKKVEVDLWDLEDLKDFNNIDFENYIIVGNYAAICSYEKNTIEAAFTILNEGPRRSSFRRRRILKAFGVDVDRKGKFSSTEITSSDPTQKTKISISPLSSALSVITKSNYSADTSVVIKSPKITSHSDAIKLLEKITHSIFFSVEVQSGIAPMLLRRQQRKTNKLNLNAIPSIEYPKYEYDSGPISLYWYARSAVNMPLLQFLAFYQTIEFYYPVYFRSEFNRKIRAILKDPSFKIERDSDISKITSIVGSKSGGTEREQLKATLHECVEPSDLQAFVEENKSRFEFFSSKQKGITSCTLNFKNRNIDIISQVADRIYDIRCKVVHVKSEDGETELELLLPYTEEAENLSYDIELVQFLAQKVLICSSIPVRL